MNRLAELMGQIAKERVRLKPVPRRGVGRFVPDPDQGAEDQAMGSPPEIAYSEVTAPGPPRDTPQMHWIGWNNDETIVDFPETPDVINTRLGASKPARYASTSAPPA